MSNPTLPVFSKGNTRRATLATTLVAVLIAVGFDSWYGSIILSRERQRTLESAAPYAKAIEVAITRRLSRLAGLRTLVNASRTAAILNEDFEPYANGMRVGATGIRALELVDRGRITHVVPMAGNESVLNYDLYADPRPFIANDVRRALETGAVTVTGPTELVQGGLGLIVRQRVGRSDFPDLVAMVIDVSAILDEASSFARPTALAYVVTDRSGAFVAGSDSTVADGVSIPITIPDGNWTVHAAPQGGWYAAIADDLRPTRIASFILVGLLSWLTHIAVGNQRRLRTAVETRTHDLVDANIALSTQIQEREAAEAQLHERDERLRFALASGHMGIWDYHPSSDRLHLSSGALGILGTPDAVHDMQGGVYLESLPEAQRQAVQKAVLNAINHGELRAEDRLVLPSGEERWIYFAGEVQRRPDGTKCSLGSSWMSRNVGSWKNNCCIRKNWKPWERSLGGSPTILIIY